MPTNYDSIVAATAGLVNYWKLSETSGTSAADSKGTNTGTYQGGVVLNQSGIPGSTDPAAQVNGSTGYVYTATQIVSPGPVPPFSMEVWYKTTNPSGVVMSFPNVQTGTPTSYSPQLYFRSNGWLYFGTYTTANQTCSAVSNSADGQWHHAVGVVAANGNLTIYVDGLSPGGNNTTQAPAASAGYWWIGAGNATSWQFSNGSFFNGVIAQAAVYNVALSAATIFQHSMVGHQYLAQASNPSVWGSLPIVVARPRSGQLWPRGGRQPVATTGLPSMVSLPVISGSASVGSVLTATSGVWTNSPTRYTYQWYNVTGGVPTAISGATSSTYTIQISDIGKTIQVSVVAANFYGPSMSSATSAPTGTVSSGGPLPQLNLTQVASDNFTRANSGSLGTGWAAFAAGGFSIASNKAQSIAAGGNFIGNYRTDTYNGDQAAVVTLGAISASGGDTIGPITRYQTSNGNYYVILVNGSVGTFGAASLWKCNGGNSFTQISDTIQMISSAVSLLGGVTGAIVELVSEGNHHTCLVNGISVLSSYDSTLTGGVPGICGLNATPSATVFTGNNAQTGAVSAALQTDNFNRANAGVSVGQSGWQIMTGYPAADPPIVSNEINTASGTHKAVVRTETYGNDQWASLAVGSIALTDSGSGFLGGLTRINPGLNSGYMGVVTAGGTTYAYGIYRLDSGSSTALKLIDAHNSGTSATDPSTTTVMLVSVGNRHSLRVGGAEVLSVTDATYTSGKPGLICYPASVGATTADNFACGNV